MTALVADLTCARVARRDPQEGWSVTALLGACFVAWITMVNLVYLLVQGLVALVLLSYLLSSFGVFIDFATTAGFVSAPVIAVLNHRIISSNAVAPADRPPRWLRLWSACGCAVLTAASVSYLYFRFV